jgi:hypothetical protein
VRQRSKQGFRPQSLLDKVTAHQQMQGERIQIPSTSRGLQWQQPSPAANDEATGDGALVVQEAHFLRSQKVTAYAKR